MYYNNQYIGAIMEITVGLAAILALLAAFAYFARRFFGAPFIERPIILGPITGLIMGDLQTGLVLGGTLELVFMGATAIGGSVPPNLPVGTILGVAFAVSADLTIEEALVIAVPAALLGSLGELFAKTISTIFANAADRYAEDGNTKGISLMAHLGNLAHALSVGIPTFVGLLIGGASVEKIIAALPAWLRAGLNTTGSLLPALGFGLLLATLATPQLLPWFFIGFSIAAYSAWGVLGVSFVGIMAALIFIYQKGGFSLSPSESAERTESVVEFSHAEKSQFFWRSFGLQSAFSFDRMQAVGFTWTLIPFLKKLYADNKDELAAALKRHLTFLNTNPWVVGPIVALTATLEKKRAADLEEVDPKVIQGVKASLMGPLAGIGDSMIQGTLIPVVGGVAASLAIDGNAIAPLLFFFVVNIVHVYVRWITLDSTFKLGSGFLEQLSHSGFQRLLEGAGIAGLMGVGGLVGTWLNIKTPVVYTIGEKTIELQAMFDKIMPKLLPLIGTLLVYWAIKKGLKNTQIVVIIFVLGIVLGALKILG